MNNSEIIRRFLEEETERRSWSVNTRSAYRRCLEIFSDFCNNELLKKDIKEFRRNDVILFKKHLEIEYRNNTISLCLTVIKSLFKWMEENGEFEISPFPTSLVLKGKSGRVGVLPTVKQIFRIRREKIAKIEQIAAFELFLSTGIRCSEMIQVSPAAINTKDIPIDIETGQRSKFVGGSFLISPVRAGVKDKEARKVYLSKMALKYIIKMCKKLNVPLRSNTPLFPWERKIAWMWMKELGAGIVNQTSIPLEFREEVNKENITTEKIDLSGVSDHFRKLVERRINREKKKLKEVGRIPDDGMKREFINLYPHSLRSFHTCLMFYRSFHGERGCDTRIMRLLGHSSFSTSWVYLKDLDVIQTDKDWRRMWIGKNSDWFRAK